MLLTRILVGALLLAVLLAGCSAAAPMTLDGRTFLSTSVTQGGAERPLEPGTQIRLSFSEGNRIGVSAGCNTMGGTYRVDDRRLHVEGGGMTAMGCDGTLHAQDDWLFGFVGSAPTLALSGNDLALASGDTVIRFLDREAADPDRPLVGPVWTVDSLISGDVVSSVPQGATATLQFGNDGTVAVNTGCNTGTGRAAIDGNSIRFAEIVLTRKACAGAAGQLEPAVLSVLRSEPGTVTIEANRLTIDPPGGGLSLVAP